MRKHLNFIVLACMLIFPMRLHAFWGDGGAGWAQIPYLAKILAENIKRYMQLREMIQQSKHHTDYVRSINAEVENALGILYSLPIKDEGVLADIRNFEIAFKKVNAVYGAIPKSKEEAMQKLHDMTIGEALKMSTSISEYAEKQEKNSISISEQSQKASPKGAARMNAQANGQILHLLAQLLRVNGQMLKLQSEHFAMVNKRSKDDVGNYQKVNSDLKQSFTKFNGNFNMPQF